MDAKDAVSDQVDSSTPLASQKAWERQAENNYIFRLEQAGLVAPVSPLSEILETVVNNLIVTNNLVIEPEVRCRVLLTAPMESFAIGHTIVVSRGLIDALPDEAALAAVLAHELSHIVLAHDSDNSQFAFSDRLIFPDTDALDRLRMVRSSDELKEADEESLVLLQNSPYKDKLQNMGLFLKQMEASRKVLPNLLRSRLSDSLVGEQPRLTFAAAAAPDLTPKDIHQMAALPLGSRVIMDPWTGRVEMNKARSCARHGRAGKAAVHVDSVLPLSHAGLGGKGSRPGPSRSAKFRACAAGARHFARSSQSGARRSGSPSLRLTGWCEVRNRSITHSSRSHAFRRLRLLCAAGD